MAWTPIPHPYSKYIAEDPNAYTAVDPDLIKSALAQSGLGPDSTSSILSSWTSMTGGASPAVAASSPATTPTPAKPPIDYQKLIESDPFYLQTKADTSAEGISDAAARAAALKRTLIDWGLIPDFQQAAGRLGLSSQATGFLQSDIDEQTRQLAARNEAEGLSQHSRLAHANEDNINSIRNALAARGMYQSGELPYGLEENARQYKGAATDAEKQALSQIEDVSGRYVAADRARQRTLASAAADAAQRGITNLGSTNLSGTGTTTGGTTKTTAAPGQFALPARTATVWDVNTASTMDAINAAKQSGGGVVIRPDDPEAQTKANAAAQAGVPVSIQVNGVGDDTPESLAARVRQMQQQYPGASFTLDLESPNFRDMTPGKMEAYAQAVQQVAGNTPLVITTEGVSDFNYGAWAKNPNVIFAPQAYWGDMTPRPVMDIVNLLVAQGVDPSRIIPVVAPGQDLGGWTGPVSVYGAPTGGQTLGAPAPPPTTAPRYSTDPGIAAAQSNAVGSGDYDPATIQAILQAVQQAYVAPVMDPTLRSGGRY